MASHLPVAALSARTLEIAALVVAVVLLGSVAIARRDAWLPAAARHRKLLLRAAGGAVVAVVVLLAIAHREELEEMLRRVEHGDPLWLAISVAFQVVSFAGYVLLTHQLYRPHAPLLGWAASTELTLGGVVATRILSAGGAGGIAFTGWVLNRAGMSAREAARELWAFLVLLYSWYVAALLVGGLVVLLGLLPAVPRALGLVAFCVGLAVAVAVVAMLRIPGDLERRAARIAASGSRFSGLAAKLATVPQVAGGATRLALAVARRRPAIMVGPFVWWAASVASLWAAFEAFGSAPAIGTIVLCYFLGQLGNLLPLPGGVGGTEGGMLGAFAASGVDAGLALVAIIAYQLISTYLPAVPGLGAYALLRRRMRRWPHAAQEPVPAASPG